MTLTLGRPGRLTPPSTPATLTVSVFQLVRHRQLPSRSLAALLLVVWLAPLVIPHAGDDDFLCAPVAASKTSTGVKSVSGGNRQAHHCIVCHSIRSFRSALADCGPVAVFLTAEHHVDALADASHRAPAFDRLPARAPPA